MLAKTPTCWGEISSGEGGEGGGGGRKSCIITFTEFGVLVNNLYFSFCVS